MIPFRYHALTVVAIFLALAAGVALGGGPLSELGRASQDDPPAQEIPADVERSLRFSGAFAGSVAGRVYARGLAGRPVAVLALPGVDQETVDQLTNHVGAAGSQVTATYLVGPTLVDPGEQTLVDTLGSQLMTQLADAPVDRDASAYVRMGQLLGIAVAGRNSTARPPDDHARAIRQSLDAAGMLQLPQGNPERGLLALVLVPPGGGTEEDQARAAILTGLVTGLAERAIGVVVAGDTASGIDGDVAAIRHTELADNVATVDGIDRNPGRVTAVLALAATLRGEGGAYGASGSDGTAPLG